MVKRRGEKHILLPSNYGPMKAQEQNLQIVQLTGKNYSIQIANPRGAHQLFSRSSNRA